MATKKKKAVQKKKAAKRKKSTPTQAANSRHPLYGDFEERDLGTLDAALYATYAGEAALGLVECCSPPATTMIQDFVVDIRGVPTNTSGSDFGFDQKLQWTREIYQSSDHGKKPFRRVIGRILDELHNHRGKPTCSVGEVFLVLLDEIPDELPKAHQQLLGPQCTKFCTDSNVKGHRNIDNRLRELKGEPRNDAQRKELISLATTIGENKRGVEQRYQLNEAGQWLFNGWPELPDLVLGRNQ